MKSSALAARRLARRGRPAFPVRFAALLPPLFLAVTPTAHAAPAGATVVHGSASFDAADRSLTVDSTPGTIIDWQSFSVAAGELTRFQQQNADSAVLNRVTGTMGSEILGDLTSNGRVFLINPNGIVFGQDVTIDTAGFVASTLDMTNDDFLAGDYRFEGDGGRIVNQGYLTTRSGNVFFIAPDIENSGVVHAEDGSLILAAGRSVRITSLDAAGIEFELQAPDDAILNLGELIAERGSVRAFAGTLEHSGAIRAANVSRDEGGAIVLGAAGDITLAEGSTLDASGADGGDIDVMSEAGTVLAGGSISARGESGIGGAVRLLGDRVGMFGDAAIDATGSAGGGEVLVGGNEKGLGPEPNAARAFVGADAAIDASATDAGDGGRIIVFSDDETRVHGDLAARGGEAGGDGGFIETSGGALQVTTTPDAGASAGAPGDWLIDPDILVVAGNVQNDIVDNSVTGTTVFTGGEGVMDSMIGDQVLEAAIAGGTSLTLDTGQAGESILIDAPLDFVADTPGLTVTFDANFDIRVDQPITNTGTQPLDYTFNYDQAGGGTGTVVVNADIDTGAGGSGQILFDAVEGGQITLNGGITLDGALRTISGTTTNVTDPNGRVTVTGLATLETLNVAGGAIDFEFLDVAAVPERNNAQVVTLSAGSIGGAGELIVTNQLDWFGGEFAGSGSTTVFGDTEIDLRGPADSFTDAEPLSIQDRTLELSSNNETIGQTWAEGDIGMSGTALLSIDSDLRSTFGSPARIVNEGGTPSVFIDSDATFFTDSVGFEVQVAFDNEGNFDVATDVDLIGGGTSPGLFTIQPASTLGLGGTHELSGTISVGGVGSTLEQISGTTVVNGQFPALEQVALPQVSILGGTLQLAPNGTTGGPRPHDYAIQDLTMSGGTLLADDTVVRVENSFDWTGGSLAGNEVTGIPRFQIDVNATAAWSGTAPKSIDGTGRFFYENFGETTWNEGDVTLNGATRITQGDQAQDGAEDFFIANGAPVTLIDGGGGAFFQVQEDGGRLSHSGSALATIEVPTVIGTSPSGIPAQLQAFGSELHLAGGGNHFGEFEVLGDLRLSGPSGNPHAFLIPSTLGLGGGGTVFFSGPAPTTVLGAYDIDRTVIDTGTFNFGGGDPAFTNVLDLQEGTLTGGGDVTVSGALNWEPAGTMTGTGVTTVTNGESGASIRLLDTGIVTAPTGRVLSGGRLLVNAFIDDTIEWNAGDLTIQDTAIFRAENDTQVAISLDADASILNGGGTPLLDFDPNTTVTMNGPAVATIATPLMSQADYNVDAGTLVFAGDSTYSGSVNIGDGAIVRFDGGTHEIFGGTDFNAVGPGTTGLAEITGGGVDILGELNIDFDNLRLDGGTLTGDGNARVSTSFEWISGDLGDGTAFGGTFLAEGATGTISGTAARTIAANYNLTNYGTLNWTGGDITIDTTGGIIESLPDPNVSGPAPAAFNIALSAPGTISGMGIVSTDPTVTLTDTSTSSATFALPADIQGPVNAGGADLHFTVGSTWTNAIDVTGGQIRFSDVNGVGHTLDGSFTGTGTVAFSGGGTSTVTAEALYDTGGTLIDTGAVAFEGTAPTTTDLVLTDGTLAGAGTLTVDGTALWNGSGTMSGSGTTLLTSTASTTISGAGARTIAAGRTLRNEGDLRWEQGEIVLGGTLDNAAGARLELAPAEGLSLTPTGAEPVFLNRIDATLATSGTGIADLAVPFSNEGTISVGGNELVLSGAGIHPGTFDVAAGSTLTFRAADAGHVLQGATSGAGTVAFGAGTHTIGGAFDSAGLSIDGGAVATALDLDLTDLTVASGSLDVDGAASVTGSLAQSGGEVRLGALDLPAGATGALTGGTLAITGPLDLAGMLAADGANLTSGTLDVGGTLTGGGPITTGAFQAAGASIDLSGATTATTLALNGGTARFATLTADSITTDAEAALTLAGVTEVSGDVDSAGDLALDAATVGSANISLGGALTGTGSVTTGSFTFAAGSSADTTAALSSATLNIATADLTLGALDTVDLSVAAGSTLRLQGPSALGGTADVGGTLDLSGNALTAGTVNVSGSVLGLTTLDAGALSTNAGATVTTTGAATIGTASLGGTSATFGGALTAGTLDLRAGTLSLGAGADIGSALIWSGGTLSGAGPTTVGPEGTLTLTDGSTLILDGTDLVVAGSGTLGADSLTLADGAAFSSTGALTAGNTDGLALDFLGDGRVTNAGSLDATGDLRFAVDLINTGTLSAPNLALASGTTTQVNSGGLTVADTLTADGTLFLGGGTVTAGELALNGTLSGNGTVTGLVTNGGLISAGTSPGSLTIDGDYTQTADGTLLVELDGAGAVAGQDFDFLEVTGAASLDGTLELVALENYDPTLGDFFVPLTYGSVSGGFATISQPEGIAFDFVFGPNGLGTTLNTLDGVSLGVASEADVVAFGEGTTVEEIEPTQEVVELGRQREQTQDECEQARRPDDAAVEGSQGVGCGSI